MIIGLSDLKGIQEQVSLEQDGEVTIFEPGIPVENLEPGRGSASDNMLYELFSVGLNAKPAFPTPDSALQEIYPFSVAMRLNGSRGIYVVPAGKTTTASIQSDWTTPSFDGEFLPQTREISDKGFVAEWRVLDLNRSFGQVIRSDNSNTLNQMAASRFGVRFIQAVDQYRQNMRSVKYGILVLLLTFVAVLFIELMRKRRINPFQYLLVGLALLLFYTLLLSMSELLGFNLAYLIAAVMTTLLIQMESYALLAGSLGLFVILAVIMYYSKQLR